MTEQYEQHARELAEACGYVIGNETIPLLPDWEPHTNRDHLAVVLREVERLRDDALQDLTERLLATCCGRWPKLGQGAFILHLFAHEPAVIAEACWEVLCGKDGE